MTRSRWRGDGHGITLDSLDERLVLNADQILNRGAFPAVL
jgi:hypothetical protein